MGLITQAIAVSYTNVLNWRWQSTSRVEEDGRPNAGPLDLLEQGWRTSVAAAARATVLGRGVGDAGSEASPASSAPTGNENARRSDADSGNIDVNTESWKTGANNRLHDVRLQASINPGSRFGNLFERGHGAEISCIQISPSGRWLVICHKAACIVYDIEVYYFLPSP